MDDEGLDGLLAQLGPDSSDFKFKKPSARKVREQTKRNVLDDKTNDQELADLLQDKVSTGKKREKKGKSVKREVHVQKQPESKVKKGKKKIDDILNILDDSVEQQDDKAYDKELADLLNDIKKDVSTGKKRGKKGKSIKKEVQEQPESKGKRGKKKIDDILNILDDSVEQQDDKACDKELADLLNDIKKDVSTGKKRGKKGKSIKREVLESSDAFCRKIKSGNSSVEIDENSDISSSSHDFDNSHLRLITPKVKPDKNCRTIEDMYSEVINDSEKYAKRKSTRTKVKHENVERDLSSVFDESKQNLKGSLGNHLGMNAFNGENMNSPLCGEILADLAKDFGGGATRKKYRDRKKTSSDESVLDDVLADLTRDSEESFHDTSKRCTRIKTTVPTVDKSDRTHNALKVSKKKTEKVNSGARRKTTAPAVIKTEISKRARDESVLEDVSADLTKDSEESVQDVSKRSSRRKTNAPAVAKTEICEQTRRESALEDILADLTKDSEESVQDVSKSSSRRKTTGPVVKKSAKTDNVSKVSKEKTEQVNSGARRKTTAPAVTTTEISEHGDESVLDDVLADLTKDSEESVCDVSKRCSRRKTTAEISEHTPDESVLDDVLADLTKDSEESVQDVSKRSSRRKTTAHTVAKTDRTHNASKASKKKTEKVQMNRTDASSEGLSDEFGASYKSAHSDLTNEDASLESLSQMLKELDVGEGSNEKGACGGDDLMTILESFAESDSSRVSRKGNKSKKSRIGRQSSSLLSVESSERSRGSSLTDESKELVTDSSKELIVTDLSKELSVTDMSAEFSEEVSVTDVNQQTSIVSNSEEMSSTDLSKEETSVTDRSIEQQTSCTAKEVLSVKEPSQELFTETEASLPFLSLESCQSENLFSSLESEVAGFANKRPNSRNSLQTVREEPESQSNDDNNQLPSLPLFSSLESEVGSQRKLEARKILFDSRPVTPEDFQGESILAPDTDSSDVSRDTSKVSLNETEDLVVGETDEEDFESSGQKSHNDIEMHATCPESDLSSSCGPTQRLDSSVSSISTESPDKIHKSLKRIGPYRGLLKSADKTDSSMISSIASDSPYKNRNCSMSSVGSYRELLSPSRGLLHNLTSVAEKLNRLSFGTSGSPATSGSYTELLKNRGKSPATPGLKKTMSTSTPVKDKSGMSMLEQYCSPGEGERLSQSIDTEDEMCERATDFSRRELNNSKAENLKRSVVYVTEKSLQVSLSSGSDSKTENLEQSEVYVTEKSLQVSLSSGSEHGKSSCAHDQTRMSERSSCVQDSTGIDERSSYDQTAQEVQRSYLDSSTSRHSIALCDTSDKMLQVSLSSQEEDAVKCKIEETPNFDDEIVRGEEENDGDFIQRSESRHDTSSSTEYEDAVSVFETPQSQWRHRAQSSDEENEPPCLSARLRKAKKSEKKSAKSVFDSSDSDDLETFFSTLKTPARQQSQSHTSEEEDSIGDFVVDDDDVSFQSDADSSGSDDSVFYIKTGKILDDQTNRPKKSIPSFALPKQSAKTTHRAKSWKKAEYDEPSSDDDMTVTPRGKTLKTAPKSIGWATPAETPRQLKTAPKSIGWATPAETPRQLKTSKLLPPATSGSLPDLPHNDPVTPHVGVPASLLSHKAKTVTNIQATQRNKTPASFLKSLSKGLPHDQIHLEAYKFITNFKVYREVLSKKLFDLFAETVFQSKLPDFPIIWNSRLTKTAGYCVYTLEKPSMKHKCRIELSVKVCDSAERTRDTLIHEMCHAAVWLLNGRKDGHGPYWKYWARQANIVHPELPVIKRCHSYSIETKYVYQCSKCGYQIGRHSKSFDTKRKVCGYCHGEFVCHINGKDGQLKKCVEATPKTPNAFAQFVKENYGSIKSSNKKSKHKDIMGILSSEFAKTKITPS